MTFHLLLPTLFAVALPALAQTPAAPAAMPAIPPHNCVKPEYPGRLASDAQIRNFNRIYPAYADCIKKYVDQAKVQSDAWLAAGNKAIEEFNAFTAEVKAESEAGKK